MHRKDNTQSKFLGSEKMAADKTEILPTNNLREEGANTECCYFFVMGGVGYCTGQSSID